MTAGQYRAAILGIAVGFWAATAIACWVLLLGECSGV